MIKKLIAISVVLLLPVSFNSSASAASKSITCYKGTAKKVFKNSTGKCPTGWSSKKPSVVLGTNSGTKNSYKIQDISTAEVSRIIDAFNKIGKLNDLLLSQTQAQDRSYSNCLVDQKNNKENAMQAVAWIAKSNTIIKNSNDKISSYKTQLQNASLSDLEKKRIQGQIDAETKLIASSNEIILRFQKYLPFDATVDHCSSLKNIEITSDSFQSQIEVLLPAKGSPEIKKIANKLVNNFCGLNSKLLEDSNILLINADPLIGYDKFNSSVMKSVYANFDTILINLKSSVNTDTTDSYLALAYPKYRVYKATLYQPSYWDSKMSRSEYGATVSNVDFEKLKEELRDTASFCKNR